MLGSIGDHKKEYSFTRNGSAHFMDTFPFFFRNVYIVIIAT